MSRLRLPPIADWTDDGLYEYEQLYGRVSRRRWAWEFLRRNREYRLAYDEIERRAQQSHPRGRPLYAPPGIRERFGVKGPLRSPLGIILPTFQKFTPQFYYGPDPDYVVSLSETQVCIIVDAASSPSDQVATINKHLQAACRRFAKVGQGEKRFSTSKFPEYLRVLDALDAGVSQRKIAKALKPVAYDRDIKNAEKNIRDAIKAAKAFRDGGYILLARDPEKTGD